MYDLKASHDRVYYGPLRLPEPSYLPSKVAPQYRRPDRRSDRRDFSIASGIVPPSICESIESDAD